MHCSLETSYPEGSEMAHRLFVYGTLRKDIKNGMFHLLARHARFVGHARVRG